MNSLTFSTIACLFLGLLAPAHAQPTALRYKAPSNQVHYHVKIALETPEEKCAYQGRISYEGSIAEGDKLSFKYQGGLKESTERKGNARSNSPFGDPFGGGVGARGASSPFAQPRNPGALRQTNATITISPTGDILSLEGDSQIPLPLGHLSLLIFEPLPDTALTAWTATNGVLLGRKAQPADGFAGDPFAKPGQPGKISAGSETSRFTVNQTSGSRLAIDKHYELNSPNTKPAFVLTGKGPLVFDRDQGLFVSSNVKYELKVKSESVELVIPVTVEYRQLSAEELQLEQRDRAVADLKLRQKDAGGGCDGIKNGHYGFHTDKQQDPWWQVDLGKSLKVADVIIYNRCNDKDMEKRADRIRVLLSEDGESWTQVYEHHGPSFFGYSDNKPLKVPLNGKPARFIRLQVPVLDYFHLDEVEVYEKGNPRNIALGKSAEQSSVHAKYSNFD